MDDDPIFALVALNESVLEDMTKTYQQALTSARTNHLAINPVSCQLKNQIAATYLKIIVAASLSFGVGMFLGTRETPLLQVSLGLILGIVVGAVLCILIILYIEKQQPDSLQEVMTSLGRIEKQGSTAATPTDMERLWTESEFERVAGVTGLSTRSLMACKAVLVDGLSFADAAVKHKLYVSQITRGLKELREKNKQ